MTTTIERHGLEASLFVATAAVAALCWMMLILGQGLLAAVLLIAGAWLGQELLFASAMLSSVRVGPDQLPELWDRYGRVAARLGVSQLPPLYVQQSGGVVNAYAVRVAQRMQVVLQSGLVDALEHDPEALEFVIAHELGHHLARHTTTAKLLFIWPLGVLGVVVPFMRGLSRGQEFTADRYGLRGSSLNAAERALMVLLGGRIAARASASAILAQWPAVGLWGHLVELTSTHPNSARRIGQLREYASSLERLGAAAPLSTTWIGSTEGAPAAPAHRG